MSRKTRLLSTGKFGKTKPKTVSVERRGASQLLAVAERLGDGSRGLQPSDQAGAAVLRRGATLEPARLRQVAFLRQASLRDAGILVRPTVG